MVSARVWLSVGTLIAWPLFWQRQTVWASNTPAVLNAS
jgi:hypothetical protein